MYNNGSYNLLYQRILILTNKIYEQFPEIYNVLSESPLDISKDNSKISKKELKNYLNLLNFQLKSFRLGIKKQDLFKTIHLFYHNDNFSESMPDVEDSKFLISLNDLMLLPLINEQYIIEYRIKVPVNFDFNTYSSQELKIFCLSAVHIKYHFYIRASKMKNAMFET